MKPKALLLLPLLATASHGAIVVQENFGGLAADNLGTTSPDVFNVTDGSVSGQWVANSVFKADGSTSTASANRAYLDLGTHIEATKGTEAGFFTFQATLAQPTGTATGDWISFGMFSTAVGSGQNFTSPGIFTSLLRSTDPNNGDYYSGPGVGNAANVGVVSGDTTFTMTLDLRPSSGYDGSSNNGTVTYARNGAAVENTYTYATDQNFQFVGFTVNGTADSAISAFSVTQVPEPSALLLGALGLLPLLRRRR